MKTFPLTIYTPFGKYLEADVESVQVRSEDYNLGILPGHSPLISTLIISVMVIKMNDAKVEYTIGGGIIKVEKDKTVLLLDSIERFDEIDLDRAHAARIRAEERLKKLAEGEEIDEKRAKLALARALNRIRLIDKNS